MRNVKALYLRHYMTSYVQHGNTLSKTLYDVLCAAAHLKTHCLRHMTSYIQLRNTPCRRHMTSYTQPGNTLPRTCNILYATGKHLAEDIIWRPVCNWETPCRRHYMTSCMQLGNTLQRTLYDIPTAEDGCRQSIVSRPPARLKYVWMWCSKRKHVLKESVSNGPHHKLVCRSFRCSGLFQFWRNWQNI